MVKVSIVIPVYNVGNYLNNCLDSILKQTYNDYEIILVDDGSYDNSGSICDSYAAKDSRIKVIHQINQGAGPARNAGIAASTGTYIMFLDADDWAEPIMLEVALERIQRSDSDLLMFGNKAIKFNRKETKIVETEYWIPEEKNYATRDECRDVFCDLYFKTSFNTPWNKMYKAAIIKENNIRFPSLRRSQDSVFNMEYYKHISSLCIIPDILYNFRLNTKKGVWKKFPKNIFECDSYCDKYIVEMLTEWGRYNGENKERIDDKFINIIFWAIGFFRNPTWKLNLKGKKDYIDSIVSDEYVSNRLNNIRCSSSHMERKRKALVEKKPYRIIFIYYKSYIKNSFFESGLYRFLSYVKHKVVKATGVEPR